MADDKHYVGGSFYRICDRTGFKVRADRTAKEWNGLIVRNKSWESRQPQDFVKGVRDYQSVPDPRPRQLDRFIGPLETKVLHAAAAGSISLQVITTVRMVDGDQLTVILDNAETFYTGILHVASMTELTLTKPLPWSVSVGREVVDISAVSEIGTPT